MDIHTSKTQSIQQADGVVSLLMSTTIVHVGMNLDEELVYERGGACRKQMRHDLVFGTLDILPQRENRLAGVRAHSADARCSVCSGQIFRSPSTHHLENHIVFFMKSAFKKLSEVHCFDLGLPSSGAVLGGHKAVACMALPLNPRKRRV